MVLFAGLAAAQQPAQDLRIVKPALRQYEDGPVMAANQTFGPGETVFFTFQIQGYKVSAERRTDLHCVIDVLDPGGVKIVETMEKDIQSGLSEEDKDWMPIVRHTFMIPPITLPGAYKIAVKVDDRLAKRATTADLTVSVRGRNVEASDKLVARNFRFLRSEDDFNPLRDPSYRAGDTVWARFDIVGYKFGARNAINVEYGIAVATTEDKVLFSQPQAAVEQKESFYPQKYVPGLISVTTQKNTPRGEYVLILTLRDQTGNQTAEEKHNFRLE